MKFERNQDPKKSMGIGLKPERVLGISVLRGITYSMSGESWNWKGIATWRVNKIHDILRKIRSGTNRKNYGIATEDGTYYTDYTNSSEGYGV